MFHFILRKQRGMHFIHADPISDCPGCLFLIACQHDRSPYAQIAQSPDCLSGTVLDSIFYMQASCILSVYGNIYARYASLSGDAACKAFHQARITDCDLTTVHDSFYAVTGLLMNGCNPYEIDCFPIRITDRQCNGMC